MGAFMILILLIIVIFIVGAILLCSAVLISRDVDRKKKSLHLPKGEVTYADLHIPTHPLFSNQYRLSGKPDYILKEKDSLIPVEYKSGRYDTPPIHHILQVAAYCQLVEDSEQVYVPYGWIIYPSGRFRVPYDPQLRFQLDKILDEMRGAMIDDSFGVNHHNPRKCHNCSFRDVCTYKLM